MFTTYDLRNFLEGLAILFAIGYWGTMLLLLWFLVRFAYKKPKQNAGKILSGSLTAAAILILFVWIIPKQLGPSKEEIQAQEEWDRKYKEAEAVFNEQCKTAGEKIYRTVDNVEGIMLLKVVPESTVSADAKTRDPMWDNAALQENEGIRFIGKFLGLYGGSSYNYVDVLQPNQSDIIRYTGHHSPLKQSLNPRQPARYAVTFENNVDPKLRRHWVAGATIRVIDRQTDEVIAEKITYAFEKGLGGTGGARMPWLFAVSCENKEIFPSKLSNFVFDVLKPYQPKQETQNVK